MKKGQNPENYLEEITFNGGKLLPNEKDEYKVCEFGNFPILKTGKPRAGVFRLMLPSEADWTGLESRTQDKAERVHDDVLAILHKKPK